MENILMGLWMGSLLIGLLMECLIDLVAFMVWPILLTIGVAFILTYRYGGWGSIFKRGQGRARSP